MYPAFGAGCCMPMFNSIRENIIKKMMDNKEYCEHKDAVYEYAQAAYKNCEDNGTPMSNRQYEFMLDQMIKLRVFIIQQNKLKPEL
jgi:hypothetical protein